MDALNRTQQDSFWEEFSLHLAVSLFIAGMLVVSVDFAMRNMSRKESRERSEQVSKAIWRALLDRFVPPPVSLEIEGILKSEVCRLQPRYTVRILREPYVNIPANHIVVRRELSYKLKNLTPDTIPAYPVRAQLSDTFEAVVHTREGEPVQLPGIRAVKIDGHNVRIPDSKSFVHNVTLKKMDTDDAAIQVSLGRRRTISGKLAKPRTS